jgi:multidrug efflux pump
MAAQAQLLGAGGAEPVLSGVYPEGLPPGASVRIDIDRQKAEALGVPFAAISATLSAAHGLALRQRLPQRGRMQQVIIQADAGAHAGRRRARPARAQCQGGMVPLSGRWSRRSGSDNAAADGALQGLSPVRIAGRRRPASAAAKPWPRWSAWRHSCRRASPWSGRACRCQERQSGAQAPMLMLLSMLVVFLVLAALYESWSIPLSVMLVVPLGLIGASPP